MLQLKKKKKTVTENVHHLHHCNKCPILVGDADDREVVNVDDGEVGHVDDGEVGEVGDGEVGDGEWGRQTMGM